MPSVILLIGFMFFLLRPGSHRLRHEQLRPCRSR
jgi:hypothetical protein